MATKDNISKRAYNKHEAFAKADLVWDIDYTIGENGITKAQILVPYNSIPSEDKDYLFTYSVTSETHGDAERFFNVLKVEELSDNKIMRKLGVKQTVWTYTARNGVDVDRKHFSKKELADMRVFDHNNLKGKNFTLNPNGSLTTAHGVGNYQSGVNGSIEEAFIGIDEALRWRIAQKAEELDREKHPDRYPPTTMQKPIQMEVTEENKAVFDRLQNKIIVNPKKEKIKTESKEPKVDPRVAAEEKRKQRQEQGRAMYESWKKQHSTGNEDK